MKKKYYNYPSTISKQAYRETKNSFTPPPNYFLHNLEEVDGYMLGLLTYLLSYPPDWVIIKSVVQKRLGFPRDKFNKAWGELIKMGHIIMERKQRGIKWSVEDNPLNIKNDEVEWLKKKILV